MTLAVHDAQARRIDAADGRAKPFVKLVHNGRVSGIRFVDAPVINMTQNYSMVRVSGSGITPEAEMLAQSSDGSGALLPHRPADMDDERYTFIERGPSQLDGLLSGKGDVVTLGGRNAVAGGSQGGSAASRAATYNRYRGQECVLDKALRLQSVREGLRGGAHTGDIGSWATARNAGRPRG